jgi:thioredoxin 1
MSSSVIHIKSLRDVRPLNKDTLVVVDCSATWCAPCKRLAPQYEDMAARRYGGGSSGANVVFAVCYEDDFFEEQRVSSLPTILFFRDGVRLCSLEGGSGGGISAISDMVERLLL